MAQRLDACTTAYSRPTCFGDFRHPNNYLLTLALQRELRELAPIPDTQARATATKVPPTSKNTVNARRKPTAVDAAPPPPKTSPIIHGGAGGGPTPPSTNPSALRLATLTPRNIQVQSPSKPLPVVSDPIERPKAPPVAVRITGLPNASGSNLCYANTAVQLLRVDQDFRAICRQGIRPGGHPIRKDDTVTHLKFRMLFNDLFNEMEHPSEESGKKLAALQSTCYDAVISGSSVISKGQQEDAMSFFIGAHGKVNTGSRFAKQYLAQRDTGRLHAQPLPFAAAIISTASAQGTTSIQLAAALRQQFPGKSDFEPTTLAPGASASTLMDVRALQSLPVSINWQPHATQIRFDAPIEVEDISGKRRSFEVDAVAVQSGNNFGGHYFAFKRDPSAPNMWYRLDDETVTRVTDAQARDEMDRNRPTGFILRPAA